MIKFCYKFEPRVITPAKKINIATYLENLTIKWTKFSYKISCNLKLQTYLISFYGR